ncbi:MAG: hypothetical protein E6Q88_01800 [Lysobacteraceae bacterium]|nr:MAG: hypothetical protein E6Q88_01800 [Xanthomonadaceae bacterium]
MLRLLFGVIVGLIVAWLLMSLFEFGSMALHPPGPHFDPSKPESIALHVANAPASAMLLVLAGWLSAAFCGGWVAAKLAHFRGALAALTIGALVTAGVVLMNAMVKHPAWMYALGALLPVPLAWFAAKLAARPVKDLPK